LARSDGSSRASHWARFTLGLALTPFVVALATRELPNVRTSVRVGDTIAFAGATFFPIVGLALASFAEVPLAASICALIPALAVLALVSLVAVEPARAMLLVDTSLVVVAFAIGGAIGRRVQHASHLLPACVIAASADLASLFSPEGPSHAIAASDRALSVLALWFPVPGLHALAPALGFGDLLFMALIFGAARVHQLPYVRVVVLALVGTALAGLAAAFLEVAVPALVPIAGATLIGLPQARRLREPDRSAVKWSMLVAASVVLAVMARHLGTR
jgi:hypothetical protein